MRHSPTKSSFLFQDTGYLHRRRSLCEFFQLYQLGNEGESSSTNMWKLGARIYHSASFLQTASVRELTLTSGPCKPCAGLQTHALKVGNFITDKSLIDRDLTIVPPWECRPVVSTNSNKPQIPINHKYQIIKITGYRRCSKQRKLSSYSSCLHTGTPFCYL